MAEEIKINHQQLLEEVNNLHNAIEAFRPYSEGYVKKIANALDDGQSDFISEAKKMLVNMRDTIAPKLLTDLQGIEKTIDATANTFKEVDSTIAKELAKKE